jgi:hypothetical protein
VLRSGLHRRRARSRAPWRLRLCCVIVAVLLAAGACSDDGGFGEGGENIPAEPDIRTQLIGFFAADGRLSSEEADCAVTYLISEVDEADLEELVMVDSFDEASDEQIAVLTEALSGCIGGGTEE